MWNLTFAEDLPRAEPRFMSLCPAGEAFCSHFVAEEAEAQGGQMTCPGSQSWWMQPTN